MAQLNSMRRKTPFDGSIEGIYADGYVHSETELGDVSPYLPETANIFSDILNRRPETAHGPLVEFVVYFKNKRYAVNWRNLPDNARPIRFKHFELDKTIFADGTEIDGEKRLMKIQFGYQFNDESGANQQEILELE